MLLALFWIDQKRKFFYNFTQNFIYGRHPASLSMQQVKVDKTMEQFFHELK
jgi:hypothetical protein